MDSHYDDRFVSTTFSMEVRNALAERGMSESDIAKTEFVFQSLMPHVMELFGLVMELIIKSGPIIAPLTMEMLGNKLVEVSKAAVMLQTQQLLFGPANSTQDDLVPPTNTAIENWIDDNLDVSNL